MFCLIGQTKESLGLKLRPGSFRPLRLGPTRLGLKTLTGLGLGGFLCRQTTFPRLFRSQMAKEKNRLVVCLQKKEMIDDKEIVPMCEIETVGSLYELIRVF